MEDQKMMNAVVVWVTGAAELIHIEDFQTGEGLGKPLKCDRIDCVSTEGMKVLHRRMGRTIVGYVDSNGAVKELVNNSKMSRLSGYYYLPGGCVLCGWENGNYAPLLPEEAMLLCQIMNGEVPMKIPANAVVLWPDYRVETIYIEDFDSAEMLGKPLNCSQVERVARPALLQISLYVQTPVTGYMDAEGAKKGLQKNSAMCEILDCEEIYGGYVFCGWKKGKYLPLSQEAAESLCEQMTKVVEAAE